MSPYEIVIFDMLLMNYGSIYFDKETSTLYALAPNLDGLIEIEVYLKNPTEDQLNELVQQTVQLMFT